MVRVGYTATKLHSDVGTSQFKAALAACKLQAAAPHVARPCIEEEKIHSIFKKLLSVGLSHILFETSLLHDDCPTSI